MQLSGRHVGAAGLAGWCRPQRSCEQSPLPFSADSWLGPPSLGIMTPIQSSPKMRRVGMFCHPACNCNDTAVAIICPATRQAHRAHHGSSEGRKRGGPNQTDQPQPAATATAARGCMHARMQASITRSPMHLHPPPLTHGALMSCVHHQGGLPPAGKGAEHSILGHEHSCGSGGGGQ